MPFCDHLAALTTLEHAHPDGGTRLGVPDDVGLVQHHPPPVHLEQCSGGSHPPPGLMGDVRVGLGGGSIKSFKCILIKYGPNQYYTCRSRTSLMISSTFPCECFQYAHRKRCIHVCCHTRMYTIMCTYITCIIHV